MHPDDSLKNRQKKTKDEFEKFLKENFEDPKNSDILTEKKTKKKPDDMPRA